MNFQELFDACSKQGKFPLVECDHTPRYADSNVGQVCAIKTDGVLVHFEGMNWNTWFWNVGGIDGRKKYMYQLQIIE